MLPTRKQVIENWEEEGTEVSRVNETWPLREVKEPFRLMFGARHQGEL